MVGEPIVGAIYRVDGEFAFPRCEVFDFNEVEGGYDVFVRCPYTGDEYGICTKDAAFTLLSPPARCGYDAN